MKTTVFRGRKRFPLDALAAIILAFVPIGETQAADKTVLTDPATTSTFSEQSSSQNIEDMQIKLQIMQEKMAVMQQEYDAQLRQMQSTIQALMARVTKTGGPPLEVLQPVPADDQDIGEELIFGVDELQVGASRGLLAPQVSKQDLFAGSGGVFPTLNGTTSTQGAGNQFQQLFNPDITVAGDFLGRFGNNKVEGRNRFSAREVEFGFSSMIDPYAKATFMFAKPEDEEIELEEGYVTLLNLPGGLQAKVGKMLSPFGKMNVLHTHDLPQTDRPSVYNYFFGEEGLNETGIALSKILPTPWFSSLDVQVGNGQTEPIFGRNSLKRPLVVGRWRNFFDITDTQSLEIGISGAAGSSANLNDPAVNPDRRTRLSGVQGIDLTYRWIPTDNLNRSFTWQTEVLTAQMELPSTGSRQLIGGYSFAEYKLSRRLGAGLRLDFSEVPTQNNMTEYAFTPYINFWQSEFGRFRLEYKRIFGQNIPASSQIGLQYTVLMGAHPPHTF